MRTISPLYFLPLLAALMLGPAGCTRTPAPVAEKKAVPETSTTLLSVVSVADPRAEPQLVKGFHNIEQNAWRWTAGSFAARLRPPAGASDRGAMLVFKFSIPENVIQKFQTIQLKATVEGVALPAQTYSKPGDQVYSQSVPAAALLTDAATVQFELDKFIPAGALEARELGVVAHMIGFEVK